MTHTQALYLIHFLVFIWGFTGILGKEITLDAPALVWWRVMVASLALALYAAVTRKNLRASFHELKWFALAALFVSAHWVCFFWAIKVSNVSTALAIISTTSFFVALVGPVIRRTRFYAYEVWLGLLVIAGLFIIFRFEARYTLGIILALICSFCAAVFSSINSVLVQKQPSTRIAFYEMTVCLILLSAALPFTGVGLSQMWPLTGSNFLYLSLLGIVCTAFAFVAGIEVMKKLSPFTCALAINMEPVYTILIALWLYGESEFMSPQFYLGAFIILATLFIEAFINQWHKKQTGASGGL